MANFRSGSLVQGQPLGMAYKEVLLSANGQNILVDGISLIRLSSSLSVVATSLFTLESSSLVGQSLMIVFEGGAANTAQLADSGNCKLEGPWKPAQYESITLVNDGFFWIEQARALTASSISFNPFITAPVSGNVLLYDSVDARWENQAVSGDITMSSAGVAEIGSGVIVNADINDSAAVAFSKLAAVTGSRALESDAMGFVSASAVTSTELGYVAGATGSLQTQINAKIPTSLATGSMLVGVANVATAIVPGADGTVLNIVGGVPAWNTPTTIGNPLADSKMFVGDVLNLAAAVAMSGDASLANTGAVTISASAVTISKCDRTVVAQATGTISSAQLLDLFNTPVELIAAPGAGLYTVIEEVELFHDYAIAPYALGGVIQLEYGSGVDIMSFPVTLLTGGADQYILGTPRVYDLAQVSGVGGLDITTSLNTNVRITNLTALFINGDPTNILKYRVRYHTVTAQA